MTATVARPGFLEGAVLALVLTLAGGALAALLGTVLPDVPVAALTFAAVNLGYLIYLLRRSRRVAGRFTVLVAWLVLTGLTLLVAPYLCVPVQIGLLWLVRSTCYQLGILAGLADLGLIVLGVGAGLWALAATGSGVLALWSFLLVQALFGSVPLMTRSASGDDNPGRRRPDAVAAGFERAERSAVDSLRRLGTSHVR